MEFSPSMERTIISIVGLAGSFTLVGVALMTNSSHFTEIVALCGPLAGVIVNGWLNGATRSQEQLNLKRQEQ